MGNTNPIVANRSLSYYFKKLESEKRVPSDLITITELSLDVDLGQTGIDVVQKTNEFICKEWVTLFENSAMEWQAAIIESIGLMRNLQGFKYLAESSSFRSPKLLASATETWKKIFLPNDPDVSIEKLVRLGGDCHPPIADAYENILGEIKEIKNSFSENKRQEKDLAGLKESIEKLTKVIEEKLKTDAVGDGDDDFVPVDEMSPNRKAYEAMADELIKEYPDQYAVFLDGKFVAVDEDIEEALSKAKKKTGTRMGAHIFRLRKKEETLD